MLFDWGWMNRIQSTKQARSKKPLSLFSHSSSKIWWNCALNIFFLGFRWLSGQQIQEISNLHWFNEHNCICIFVMCIKVKPAILVVSSLCCDWLTWATTPVRLAHREREALQPSEVSYSLSKVHVAICISSQRIQHASGCFSSAEKGQRAKPSVCEEELIWAWNFDLFFISRGNANKQVTVFSDNNSRVILISNKLENCQRDVLREPKNAENGPCQYERVYVNAGWDNFNVMCWGREYLNHWFLMKQIFL